MPCPNPTLKPCRRRSSISRAGCASWRTSGRSTRCFGRGITRAPEGSTGSKPAGWKRWTCSPRTATIEIQALHKPGEGPKGREEYTKYWDFYFGDAGPLPYVFQTSLDQRIEVHGDEAVQYSNQLGIFQARSSEPMLSLSRRVNYLRRTPDGWKIYKTTGDSAFASTLNDLRGPLNPLPEMEARTQWTYDGKPTDPMGPLNEKAG